MKTLQLTVRELALPVPRVGSIELDSGYGPAAAEGIEVHLKVQSQRAKASRHYRAEVRLKSAFEREGYRFEVGGRIDGLYAGERPKIEEIKTCFGIPDLREKLQDPSHPYCLQLKTYGYLYRLEHGLLPELSFHLVSTRTFTTEDLAISLDVDEYEEWLDRRLEELVREAKASEERGARRKKTSAELAFPFESPRPGQIDLIATVEEGIEARSRMLLQAPTGLGKTVGVTFPALREALSRGQRLLYVTPKNSQFSVAEDAVDRFREASGARVRSLTVTAKSKICFKAEPLCNPDYCEYARDYYTKVHDFNLAEKLAAKKKLTSRVFRKLGEQYQVCPFELQFEASRDADVVICDYNYVFAPRASLGRLDATYPGEKGKPNLVVDEAHNLFPRAIGYYSAELSTETLDRMREAMAELEPPWRRGAERLLEECSAIVAAARPEGCDQSRAITPDAPAFHAQEGELRSFLTRYLESDVEIRPRDPVLRLCFYWGEFTAALEYLGAERPEFFAFYRPLPRGGHAVKISCCDASEMLKRHYDRFEHVIGFSATLKPFEYYAKLSGLDPVSTKVAEFHSPFPRERRKLIIIREISTKYSERERNYRKVAEVISRVSALRSGNYFAFFPSFDFLERVLAIFTPPPGFVVLRQHRHMSASDIEAVLGHLRDRVAPAIVFGVQGGVFAEGVDYPGEMIIGAFVIGPPLPTFDLEREKMRAYYDEQYGAGFDYAYSFPAMAKAVQAAGRVVRSATDRGLIVLMDNRFLSPSYSQSMPKDWFDESPSELLSSGILKDVARFWEETE